MYLKIPVVSHKQTPPPRLIVKDPDQQAWEAAGTIALKKVKELFEQGQVGFPLQLQTIQIVAEEAYRVWLGVLNPSERRQKPKEPITSRDAVSYNFAYFNQQPQALQIRFLDLAREMLNCCPQISMSEQLRRQQAALPQDKTPPIKVSVQASRIHKDTPDGYNVWTSGARW